MSWIGALGIMAALVALLYAVEVVDVALGRRLDAHGLRPREVAGLYGIVTAPFLHSSWWQLTANALPLLLIGWVVLLAGARPFAIATALVAVLGGALTWLVAPTGNILGTSGLIFGWLGYLFGRAYFSRRPMWIIAAIAVAIMFGGLLGGLLPSIGRENSWQAHLCSFVGGVAAAWVLHPRRLRKPKKPKPTKGRERLNQLRQESTAPSTPTT